jgi:uncharacterized RDD family membrane protein YckC
MGSPLTSPNGDPPVRATVVKDAGHAGVNRGPTNRDRHPMSSTAESPVSDTVLPTTLEENVPYVGLLTRLLSWAVDVLFINLVAIITGVGVQLIASIFPITKNLKPLFLAIAGGVYLLWTAAYFVAFWSVTGQTLGSRLMQVRLVTVTGEKVKPVRAFVRWISMNLAMVPLPWGYVPIPFRRLGFPDWLAHTRVIEAQQLSIAAARQERTRNERDRSRQTFPPISPKPDSSAIRPGDATRRTDALKGR